MALSRPQLLDLYYYIRLTRDIEERLVLLYRQSKVVGGLYRLESKNGIPNSTVKFGEQHLITAAGKHPITDGLTPFRITDETYKGLFISANIQPLLLTDNPTSDRTVAWIGPSTTSKVVFIQLGHDHTPFRHPAYRALVHNSILWTGGKLK